MFSGKVWADVNFSQNQRSNTIHVSLSEPMGLFGSLTGMKLAQGIYIPNIPPGMGDVLPNMCH